MTTSLTFKHRIEQWDIAQYLPADGWYFVHTSSEGSKTLHRLVMWGIDRTTGRIYGFMSHRAQPAQNMPITLEPVPLIEGCYVHRDDLSRHERQLLAGFRGDEPATPPAG